MELFYEIDLDDMKDSEGNYFKTTYDRAMFYPIV